MHYLEIITAKLLTSIQVYKTPEKVIEKLHKYDYLIQNPPYNVDNHK